MRVWVTRTAPDADLTAERLRGLGHSPLVSPVLAAQPLQAGIDLAGVGALAFTSRRGVHRFAALSPERSLPVFAVGEATARAAREAGFAQVSSADGDVHALADAIGAARPRRGAVLHPSGEETAGDLTGLLEQRGVPARRQAVYAVYAADLHDAVAAALHAHPPELDAVLIHSPAAARRVAEILETGPAAQHLAGFCISPAAAEPLIALNLRELHVAPFPNETSLLKLLGG